MEFEQLLAEALGDAEPNSSEEWLDSSMIFNDLAPAERATCVEVNREVASRIRRLSGWRS